MTGMELSSNAQQGEEKVIQLVLSSCDLALAAFLPPASSTSSIVDTSQFLAQLDGRLQYLLRIATSPSASTSTSTSTSNSNSTSNSTSTSNSEGIKSSSSSHWHRHCALAASRELDGWMRLRGICQAYATALSVRHRTSSSST